MKLTQNIPLKQNNAEDFTTDVVRACIVRACIMRAVFVRACIMRAYIIRADLVRELFLYTYAC